MPSCAGGEIQLGATPATVAAGRMYDRGPNSLFIVAQNSSTSSRVGSGRVGERERVVVSQPLQPTTGPGQGHTDVPAAPLGRPARQRVQHPVDGEVAGRVIEGLCRQRPGAVGPGHRRGGGRDAGRGLDQTVEPAQTAPGALPSVRGDGRADDARPDPGDRLRAEAEPVEGHRPVGLEHHVRRGDQLAQPAGVRGHPQVEEGVALAEPGVDEHRVHLRQVGSADSQDVGSVGGQRATGDGTGDDPGQVEHPQTRGRRLGQGRGEHRAVAEPAHLDEGKLVDRPGLPVLAPFPLAAGHAGAQTHGVQLEFQRLGLETADDPFDGGALARRPKKIQDPVAVVREVTVQLDPPVVPGAVIPGDRVPRARRWLAGHPQVPFAAEDRARVTGVHGDLRRGPAAAGREQAAGPDSRGRHRRGRHHRHPVEAGKDVGGPGHGQPLGDVRILYQRRDLGDDLRVLPLPHPPILSHPGTHAAPRAHRRPNRNKAGMTDKTILGAKSRNAQKILLCVLSRPPDSRSPPRAAQGPFWSCVGTFAMTPGSQSPGRVVGNGRRHPVRVQRSLYEVLDVPPSATAEQIRHTYRVAARRTHPGGRWFVTGLRSGQTGSRTRREPAGRPPPSTVGAPSTAS